MFGFDVFCEGECWGLPVSSSVGGSKVLKEVIVLLAFLGEAR